MLFIWAASRMLSECFCTVFRVLLTSFLQCFSNAFGVFLECFPSPFGMLLGCFWVILECFLSAFRVLFQCFWSDPGVLMEVFWSGPRPCLSLRLRPTLRHLADGTLFRPGARAKRAPRLPCIIICFLFDSRPPSFPTF